MQETKYTRKLMEALTQKVLESNGVIFKFSDRFTKAIPDMTITVPPRGTSWLELKSFDSVRDITYKQLQDRVQKDALQFRNMKKLSYVTRNAWYLMYHNKDLYITRPEYLDFELCTIHTVPFDMFSEVNYYEQKIDEDGGRIIRLNFYAHNVVWDLLTKERT